MKIPGWQPITVSPEELRHSDKPIFTRHLLLSRSKKSASLRDTRVHSKDTIPRPSHPHEARGMSGGQANQRSRDRENGATGPKGRRVIRVVAKDPMRELVKRALTHDVGRVIRDREGFSGKVSGTKGVTDAEDLGNRFQ